MQLVVGTVLIFATSVALAIPPQPATDPNLVSAMAAAVIAATLWPRKRA
jgi:hypothetical protein